MLRSSIILASLLFSPASFTVTQPGDVLIPAQAIVQVVCLAPDKNPQLIDVTYGTAFRVGGYFLSVNHVTSARGRCSIGTRRIAIAYRSPRADFSMIDADEGPFLKVDCGGFVKGREYVAIGYARGLPTLTQVDVTATGESINGMAVLAGVFAFVPGMSGGAVVDKLTGNVVGAVNQQDFEDGVSLSLPLSATPLCKKASA